MRAPHEPAAPAVCAAPVPPPPAARPLYRQDRTVQRVGRVRGPSPGREVVGALARSVVACGDTVQHGPNGAATLHACCLSCQPAVLQGLKIMTRGQAGDPLGQCWAMCLVRLHRLHMHTCTPRTCTTPHTRINTATKDKRNRACTIRMRQVVGALYHSKGRVADTHTRRLRGGPTSGAFCGAFSRYSRGLRKSQWCLTTYRVKEGPAGPSSPSQGSWGTCGSGGVDCWWLGVDQVSAGCADSAEVSRVAQRKAAYGDV